MSTVFIDRKDIEIRTDGNSLSFYSAGKKIGNLPLAPLKRIVIIGNIKIETSVLYKLINKGISVIFLTGKLKYGGMLNGPIHNNGLLRVKQYEKSISEFAQKFSKELIIRKINSQRQFILEIKEIKPILSMHIDRAIEILERIITNLEKSPISNESLRGLEGSASSTYFAIYSKIFPDSLKFLRRIKRPPKDPVNAMLSFCYTLLHYEIVREIQLIGLDPTIGFYHQFEYGRESLACDLVEIFRVNIDRFVYELFKERHLISRDFMKDEESGGVYLKKAGRKKFYPLYEQWAQEQRPLWREEVQSLARRILEEENALSD